MSNGQAPPGGGPLAQPPGEEQKNPLEHTHFHTIMARITKGPDGQLQVDGQDAAPGAAPAAAPARAGGKVAVLFGGKGGVGSTFTGINLARAMTAQNKDVCLVDLDFQMGDILVAMNMVGRTAISHLLAEVRRNPDGFAPRKFLDRHKATGAYVVSQTHCLEELDAINPAEMTKLFGTLRQAFPYTIADGLRTFDDTAIVALDCADTVLLIVSQDVPSVRSAARSAKIFHRIGYGQDKLIVVLNRFSKKAAVSPEDVARSVRIRRVVPIRNDFKTVIRSINEGLAVQDMAPKSKLVQDVETLAGAMGWKVGGAAAAPAKKKGGLFGRK